MEWFKMPTSWGKAINVMTNEEAGRAIKIIFAYVLDREEIAGTGREEVFTAMALDMLKREIEKYENAVVEEERKKEKNRERARRAAQARWKQQQEDACIPDDTHEHACDKHGKHTQACTIKNIDIYKEKEKEEDTEAEKEEEYISCSEPLSGASELPVAEIPLNDNTSFPVYRRDADEYAALYPAVDIDQELRNIRGWCLANPSRRKTKRGVKAFINSWLSRSQDKAGKRDAVPENPFLAYALGEKDCEVIF